MPYEQILTEERGRVGIVTLNNSVLYAFVRRLSSTSYQSGDTPGGGDGFEPGVDAESPEETTDVVPDCFRAQVELGSDLLCRATLLQKTKHLDLTWGEVRGWGCEAVARAFLQQPEDADHLFTVLERHRADLHRDPLPGGRQPRRRSPPWPQRCRAPSA